MVIKKHFMILNIQLKKLKIAHFCTVGIYLILKTFSYNFSYRYHTVWTMLSLVFVSSVSFVFNNIANSNSQISLLTGYKMWVISLIIIVHIKIFIELNFPAVCACILSCSVESDSLWPYWLKPARLLCPWDYPGKNTGVGCRFLLQGIFRPRDWTHVSYISCTGRQILYRWATS